jgi:hypothetical protein
MNRLGERWRQAHDFTKICQWILLKRNVNDIIDYYLNAPVAQRIELGIPNLKVGSRKTEQKVIQ